MLVTPVAGRSAADARLADRRTEAFVERFQQRRQQLIESPGSTAEVLEPPPRKTVVEMPAEPSSRPIDFLPPPPVAEKQPSVRYPDAVEIPSPKTDFVVREPERLREPAVIEGADPIRDTEYRDTEYMAADGSLRRQRPNVGEASVSKGPQTVVPPEQLGSSDFTPIVPRQIPPPRSPAASPVGTGTAPSAQPAPSRVASPVATLPSGGGSSAGSPTTVSGSARRPAPEVSTSIPPAATRTSDPSAGFAEASVIPPPLKPAPSVRATADGVPSPQMSTRQVPTPPVVISAQSNLACDIDGPATFNVGEPLDFTVAVRNHSDKAVDNVYLEFILPEGAEITRTSPELTVGRQAWQLGRLEAGAQARCRVQFKCNQPIDSVFQTWIYSPAVQRTTLAALSPDIQVQIGGGTQLKPGGESKLAVTITNRGRGRAEEITITPTLSHVLRDRRTQRGAIDIGSLSTGETRTIEIPVEVVSSGTAVAEVFLQAAGGVEMQTTHKVEVQAPKLRVSTRGPATQNLRDIEVYAAEITNEGNASLEWVTVIAALDEGLTLVDAEAGARLDSSMRLLGWEIRELKPGENMVLRWWAVGQRPGAVRQRLFVEADGGVRAESMLDTQVESRTAVGIEVLDLEDPAVIDGEVTYQLRVFNHGAEAAENLVLVVDLPQAFEAIRLDGQSERESNGQRVVFAPITRLDPGQAHVWQVRGVPRALGWHRVKLTLTQGKNGPVLSETAVETQVMRDDR